MRYGGREGGKQRENDATNFSDCIPGQKSRYPDYALTQNGRGHSAAPPARNNWLRTEPGQTETLTLASVLPSLFSLQLCTCFRIAAALIPSVGRPNFPFRHRRTFLLDQPSDGRGRLFTPRILEEAKRQRSAGRGG